MKIARRRLRFSGPPAEPCCDPEQACQFLDSAVLLTLAPGLLRTHCQLPGLDNCAGAIAGWLKEEQWAVLLGGTVPQLCRPPEPSGGQPDLLIGFDPPSRQLPQHSCKMQPLWAPLQTDV